MTSAEKQTSGLWAKVFGVWFLEVQQELWCVAIGENSALLKRSPMDFSRILTTDSEGQDSHVSCVGEEDTEEAVSGDHRWPPSHREISLPKAGIEVVVNSRTETKHWSRERRRAWTNRSSTVKRATNSLKSLPLQPHTAMWLFTVLARDSPAAHGLLLAHPSHLQSLPGELDPPAVDSSEAVQSCFQQPCAH